MWDRGLGGAVLLPLSVGEQYLVPECHPAIVRVAPVGPGGAVARLHNKLPPIFGSAAQMNVIDVLPWGI